MSEYQFWQYLTTLGGLQNGWWYSALVTPAILLAISVVALTAVAARQTERKLLLFVLMVVACAPIVLISPSFYAAQQPAGALELVGLSWPDAPNQFSRQSAQTLGLYLNFLAQLGIIGSVFATMLGLGSLSMVASTTNVPVISTAARQVTQVVRDKTQRFRRNMSDTGTRAALAVTNCPYGRLEVLNGIHTGNQIAVRPGNTLGRKECDIIITDSVTSRLHARFDVDEHRRTTVADQQSANGLFVIRLDELSVEQIHDVGALNGLPFALRSGDVLVLGDTAHPEDGQYAVKLRFDHDHF